MLGQGDDPAGERAILQAERGILFNRQADRPSLEKAFLTGKGGIRADEDAEGDAQPARSECEIPLHVKP